MRTASVLIVDDDPSIRQTMAFVVKAAGLTPLSAQTGQQALELCRRETIDVVLLDVELPDTNGLKVLALLRERHPDVGVIIVSVVKEVAVAVEAMKLGALDYLTKDFSPPELSAHLTKALQQIQASRELVWLREEVDAKGRKPMVVGQSAAGQSLLTVANKVANTPVTVLITGESGTGKEVLARYLHDHSSRHDRPFVAINLPAIPSELVESTLFGHEKGSFTGATRQAFGKFELANGGTVFLDELAELRLDVQAKLLRFLQEREIERVGGTRTISLDVRIVCATNRNLQSLVAKGQFREDLYWRLKVLPIEMPPLRNRREDIAELAAQFLGRFSKSYGRPLQSLTPGAQTVLRQYSWPGNIRELENLMERLVVICDATQIDANDLPLDLSVAADLSSEVHNEASFAAARASFEKNYLLKVLQQHGWNQRLAAEHLGIGYSTLKNKVKAYGLSPDASGDDEG